MLVGIVRGARGLAGELRVEPTGDDPGRLCRLERVFVGREVVHRRVLAAREAGRGVLLRLEGILTREDAEALRGAPLFIRRDELEPPGPGEYYVADLVGMEVFTESGQPLGVLEEVWHPGANDVYVVRGGREWLIPATREVVLEVDLAARRMKVRLLPGLEGC